MTETEQWLLAKKQELLRVYALHGEIVNSWDVAKFLAVINAQARQIRRLKTRLGISWYSIPGIWGHWRGPVEVWPLFVYLLEDFKP